MKVYHTCGSWDLSPFIGCISFHYCYINIFYFWFYLLASKISVVVLFLPALLFSNMLQIFTYFIILFVILY